MKNLILLITLILISGLGQMANASTAEIVPGQLIVDAEMREIILELPNRERFRITGMLDKNSEIVEGCALGEYEVVENYAPEGTYTLIDIIDCKNNK